MRKQILYLFIVILAAWSCWKKTVWRENLICHHSPFRCSHWAMVQPQATDYLCFHWSRRMKHVVCQSCQSCLFQEQHSQNSQVSNKSKTRFLLYRGLPLSRRTVRMQQRYIRCVKRIMFGSMLLEIWSSFGRNQSHRLRQVLGLIQGYFVFQYCICRDIIWHAREIWWSLGSVQSIFTYHTTCTSIFTRNVIKSIEL